MTKFIFAFLIITQAMCLSSEISHIESVTLGQSASCISGQGKVDCWNNEVLSNYEIVSSVAVQIKSNAKNVEKLVSGTGLICTLKSRKETETENWVECWGKNKPTIPPLTKKPSKIEALGETLCVYLESEVLCIKGHEVTKYKGQSLKVFPRGAYSNGCVHKDGNKYIECSNGKTGSWTIDQDRIVWKNNREFCVYNKKEIECLRYSFRNSSWSAFRPKLLGKEIVYIANECVLYVDGLVECYEKDFSKKYFSRKFDKIQGYGSELHSEKMYLIVNNTIVVPSYLNQLIPYKYNYIAQKEKYAFQCNYGIKGSVVGYFTKLEDKYGDCVEARLLNGKTNEDLGYSDRLSCVEEDGNYVLGSLRFNLVKPGRGLIDMAMPRKGLRFVDHHSMHYTVGFVKCRSYLPSHGAYLYTDL